jgi:hypothetical protein
MKKLMIAALAACAFGAYADNTCAPGEVVEVAPTLVYKFKATVYTPKGISRTEAAVPGSVCAPDSGTEASTAVIRAKDKTKFAGWIYDCNGTCSTLKTGSMVAWDSKRKSQLNDAQIGDGFIHVIGKKQKDAEWMWGFRGTATYNMEANYELVLAGFGKYSAKKGFYTSFKGNFAGTVDAVTYAKAKTLEGCNPAGFWLCEDLTTLVDDEAGVAYGSWTVKYSKSASKKFAKNGYLSVPKYVTVEQGL